LSQTGRRQTKRIKPLNCPTAQHNTDKTGYADCKR
jgi:hypothetical protein